MSRVAIALVLFIASCTEERELTVSFTERMGGVAGFGCRENPSDTDQRIRLLAMRAATAGRAAIVIDFVDLSGGPSCRPTELATWCSHHECAPMPAYRRCVDFDLTTADAGLGRPPIAAAVQGVLGTVLTDDAPSNRTVIVRVAGTTQTCAELETETFDRESLVGCAYTCPFSPDDSDGTLTLDLPTFGPYCERDVASCALDFVPIETDELAP